MILESLTIEHLNAPDVIEHAFGSYISALVAIATGLTRQIDRLASELDEPLDQHP